MRPIRSEEGRPSTHAWCLFLTISIFTNRFLIFTNHFSQTIRKRIEHLKPLRFNFFTNQFSRCPPTTFRKPKIQNLGWRPKRVEKCTIYAVLSKLFLAVQNRDAQKFLKKFSRLRRAREADKWETARVALQVIFLRWTFPRVVFFFLHHNLSKKITSDTTKNMNTNCESEPT